jgi:hypothetical protein
MNAMTLESLKTILGREIEEAYLTVAKSSVFGLDSGTIAETMGVTKDEIEGLMQTEDYKDVRLLVGAEHQRAKVETDSSWDGLEASALQKLSRRVTIEQDTKVLLKIAEVSNRAQRKTNPQKEMSPLDAGTASQRIPLQLTKRYTEKLQAGQVVERTETQQISLLNGSAANPTFEEVQGALRDAAANGKVVGLAPLEREERAKNLAGQIAKEFLDGD